LLKKGLQLTADLLAFNTPSGFVGHSGHQHRRLPVDWSQLANWVASHFRLFCLQPQGMLLEICLIACEALIALTRSADQQLLRTNVALRDAFDLANHRWFSADGAAAATCAKPRSGNNPLMEQLCMSDEFLHALHEIIPSEIVELSSLAAALFNLQ
jgi:hypothetical protein